MLNRDKPNALLVGVELTGALDIPGTRPALATALFRDGQMSLVRAARLANMPTGDFASHLSRLGISVIDLTPDDAEQDMDTLESWLASS